MAARLVRFQEGMKLGHGYDVPNGSALPSPAVQGSISSIQDAGGQTVTKGFLRIDDQKTLHETIGVNVDAGGSYFGVGGDVKVEYAKECNLSKFATHVMIRVSVEDAFESFDDPVLTVEASDLLKIGGTAAPDRFKQRFGDVFIDGLRRGGEYFATWEIVSTDSAVRDQIATHVEASFDDVLVSAHLDVDIRNTAATSSAHVEVHVHVFQAGSIDRTDQTMAEIMTKAQGFPPTVAGGLAVPFAVALADYSALRLPVDAFDFIQIQNQVDVLAEHAQKRFSFLTQRNSISYARQHPEQFINADDTKLVKELIDITDAINIMEMEASTCLRDASLCKFTSFDISSFPLPAPKPFAMVQHDTWLGREPMKTARSGCSVVAANNGRLYVIGGQDLLRPMATVEEYDPTTNIWTTKAPMPTARYFFGLAAASNGRLYAVGGFGEYPNDTSGATFAVTEEYDPVANSWATMAPMPTARGGLGLATASNGKIYAVGGSGDSDVAFATVEEYDPASDTWVSKKPMPTARSSLGLASTSYGMLYALGGGSNYVQFATVEAYDPATDLWTTKAPIRMPQNLEGATVGYQNKLYAVCSVSATNDVFTVEEYSLDANTWATKALMPTARLGFGLAFAADGRLYAVGGSEAGVTTFTPLATVESYTP